MVASTSLLGKGDFDCCVLGHEAADYAEAKIDAALTPDVLSRLAFKGVTPSQAREYLRKRVALAVAEEVFA